MGHSHSHEATDAQLARTPRLILATTLIVVAIATVIGLIWLWPDTSKLDGLNNPYAVPEGVVYFSAEVTGMAEGCSQSGSGTQLECYTATVVPAGGTMAGTEVPLELIGAPSQSGIRVGDSLQVMELPGAAGEPATLAYMGVNRQPVLLILMLIFVVAVLAVARWKGLFAIIGLVFSGAVLLNFMLPALLVGSNGIAVALVGSTAIMFVVLYVAHGISWRTSAAFLGTLLGLLVTAGLGIFAVGAARLNGLDENAMFVSQIVPGLNFQELLACALVVAGLGVLNDVTITQASAVWEIRAAAPNMSRRAVFASGMRIGRDHIASTIYTIVFAYAGAALTLLLLVQFYDRPLFELVTTEEFGGEVVRTLASAIGLVLSVPLTTGIAALTLGPASLTEAPKAAADASASKSAATEEQEPSVSSVPKRAAKGEVSPEALPHSEG